MTVSTAALITVLMLGSASGFSVVPNNKSSHSTTQLAMGLFDGVKDAFSAPALERSTLDAERETPIDRWFGWSVNSQDTAQQGAAAVPSDFIDAMDPANYVAVELVKPMGIIFEENDEQYGGIFVQSLKEASAAQGLLEPGDQLVGVGTQKVSGLPFDSALGAIVDDEAEKTRLVLFRGNAKQLYGPTGASQEWLDEFLSGGVEVST